jgi:hypothetical protein
MKFNKVKLDESLFDDELDFDIEPAPFLQDVDAADDDFSFDEDIMEGPEEGAPSGIADNIMRLINDEWEAVQGYNNFVELLRSTGEFDEEVIAVIQDIAAEENKHVGQLQELLKKYSPNAANIKVGEAEAKAQMMPKSSMISGIQFWNVPTNNNPTAAPVSEEECCTLIDVDDEW